MLTQGLIRVGGRLQRAPIDTDAKHPVILPKKHHVVKLIIKYCHHISGHSGLEYTLSLIRQRFWIINARSTVRGILNECFSCRRRQAPTAQQKMANLPEDRITPSKPQCKFELNVAHKDRVKWTKIQMNHWGRTVRSIKTNSTRISDQSANNV